MAVALLLFSDFFTHPQFAVTLDWEGVRVSLAQHPLLGVFLVWDVWGRGREFLGARNSEPWCDCLFLNCRVVPVLDFRECSQRPARSLH